MGHQICRAYVQSANISGSPSARPAADCSIATEEKNSTQMLWSPLHRATAIHKRWLLARHCEKQHRATNLDGAVEGYGRDGIASCSCRCRYSCCNSCDTRSVPVTPIKPAAQLVSPLSVAALPFPPPCPRTFPPLPNPTPFNSVSSLLSHLGLSSHLPLFEREELTLPRVLLLSREDLQELLRHSELANFIHLAQKENETAAAAAAAKTEVKAEITENDAPTIAASTAPAPHPHPQCGSSTTVPIAAYSLLLMIQLLLRHTPHQLHRATLLRLPPLPPTTQITPLTAVQRRRKRKTRKNANTRTSQNQGPVMHLRLPPPHPPNNFIVRSLVVVQPPSPYLF